MLLIIDNYDSFTYNLYQCIAPFYADVRVIRNDKLTLADIEIMNPDGIILSPGPGHPNSAGICVDLIRALVTRKMNSIPLLGVCLGHQAITVALGGRVIKSEEICHGKQDAIFHSQDGLYQALSSPLTVGRYHSLIAERDTLPSTLIVDAEGKEKIIMGIRHEDLPIYGVQFHPESILTPEGHELLKRFIEICTGQPINNGVAA